MYHQEKKTQVVSQSSNFISTFLIWLFLEIQNFSMWFGFTEASLQVKKCLAMKCDFLTNPSCCSSKHTLYFLRGYLLSYSGIGDVRKSLFLSRILLPVEVVFCIQAYDCFISDLITVKQMLANILKFITKSTIQNKSMKFWIQNWHFENENIPQNFEFKCFSVVSV